MCACVRVCVYVREREREEVGAGEGKRGSFKCLLKPDIVGPDRAYLGPAVRGLHCVSTGKPKGRAPRLKERPREGTAVPGTWQAFNICWVAQRMEGQISRFLT